MDHLREWQEHATQFAPKRSPRLTWLQIYPSVHRRQPREIQRSVERAFAEYKRQGCDDDALLASLYNDHAYALHDLGDMKRALGLAEKALAIRRRLFGDRHPDTANSLNNVAFQVNAIGNPGFALELAEQALAIRRELFGECHPDTATSLNNIAGYTSLKFLFEKANIILSIS
ncbi:MAG: tetratricopeptide repeat protein [Pseudomonadota bacterium]|nr:tetratricopeptide repeat protein [Pseudomonadota bacterium]